jgi:NO-binding membrane sensor protein with MHYT domain
MYKGGHGGAYGESAASGSRVIRRAGHSGGGPHVVTVHNFANGLLNPVLAYAVSCLGAFLGLRCITRARAYTGFARARWLSLAAFSVGATGIWTMHFIAMLGYAIPGQQIVYNVPLTIASMLIAIAVVGVGLFIVGFGNGGLRPLLIGGVIVGLGVAAMHYMGMAAMIMPDSVHYNTPLFILSVLIAIVAGSAALWIGTWVRGTRATVGASLVMGVAVSGMHYTGMAAMRVTMGSMSAMSGSGSESFLVPLLAGITIVTFAVTLVVSLAPTEDEIHEDARLQDRIATGVADGPADQQPRPRQRDLKPQFPEPQSPPVPQPPTPPLPTRRPSADALAGRRNKMPHAPDR